MTLKGRCGITCPLDTLSETRCLTEDFNKCWTTNNLWLNSLKSITRVESLCVLDREMHMPYMPNIVFGLGN